MTYNCYYEYSTPPSFKTQIAAEHIITYDDTDTWKLPVVTWSLPGVEIGSLPYKEGIFSVEPEIAPFLTFEQPDPADTEHVLKVTFNGSNDVLALTKYRNIFSFSVTLHNNFDQRSDQTYSSTVRITCQVYHDLITKTKRALEKFSHSIGMEEKRDGTKEIKVSDLIEIVKYNVYFDEAKEKGCGTITTTFVNTHPFLTYD